MIGTGRPKGRLSEDRLICWATWFVIDVDAGPGLGIEVYWRKKRECRQAYLIGRAVLEIHG